MFSQLNYPILNVFQIKLFLLILLLYKLESNTYLINNYIWKVRMNIIINNSLERTITSGHGGDIEICTMQIVSDSEDTLVQKADRLLGVDEACKFLGKRLNRPKYSRTTLYRRFKEEKIKSVDLSGRRYVYESELIRYLSQMK